LRPPTIASNGDDENRHRGRNFSTGVERARGWLGQFAIRLAQCVDPSRSPAAARRRLNEWAAPSSGPIIH
jgi:hypothetical protein